MLNNQVVSYRFKRALKCGFYLDFFYKKVCEVFIRNFLICGAQFFSEKYLVEFVTKVLIDRLVDVFSTLSNYYTVQPFALFLHVVYILFYVTSLVLLTYLLFI